MNPQETPSVAVLAPPDGAVVPTTAGPPDAQARLRAQEDHADQIGLVFLCANGTTMARTPNNIAPSPASTHAVSPASTRAISPASPLPLAFFPPLCYISV